MFKKVIGSILVLVGLANAENVIEEQDIQLKVATQTTIEQDHFWAINDLLIGSLVGLYVPLNLYARDGDCYSRFWQVGALAVEYSQLADGNVLTRNENII